MWINRDVAHAGVSESAFESVAKENSSRTLLDVQLSVEMEFEEASYQEPKFAKKKRHEYVGPTHDTLFSLSLTRRNSVTFFVSHPFLFGVLEVTQLSKLMFL